MEASIMDMIAGFMPVDTSSSSPPSSPAVSLPTAPASHKDSLAAAGEDVSLVTKLRDPGRPHEVHMICFSKDRAFQLDQLLRSAREHLLVSEEEDEALGLDGGPLAAVAALRMSVLYVASAIGASAAPRAEATSRAETERRTVIDGPGRNRSTRKGTTTARPPPGSGNEDPSLRQSYELLRQRYPRVRFVEEKPDHFRDQLREIILGEDAEHRHADVHRFVLFCVDDMFFFRDVSLTSAARILVTDPSLLSVHLRLHPGLNWSQTAGSPCHVPPLMPTEKAVVFHHGDKESTASYRSCSAPPLASGGESRDKPTAWIDSRADGRAHRPATAAAADFGLLTFIRREGTGEWDYPWDLTGGLYRREDALAIIRGVVSAYGQDAAGNPNLLEYHGNRLLTKGCAPRDDSCASSDSTSRPTPSTGASEHARRDDGPGRAARIRPAGLSSSALSEDVEPARGAREGASDTAADVALRAAGLAPRCACLGRATLVSLAVNRVQETYNTPICPSRGGSVAELNQRLWSKAKLERFYAAHDQRGERSDGDNVGEGTDIFCQHWTASAARTRVRGFDGRAYRSRALNSVHVGDLLFEKDADAGRCDVETNKPTGATPADADDALEDKPRVPSQTVTVLLPVKDGGEHLLDAVHSVLACVSQLSADWAVELLIIDDGSKDGAVELAVAAIHGPRETTLGERMGIGAEHAVEKMAETESNVDRTGADKGGGEGAGLLAAVHCPREAGEDVGGRKGRALTSVRVIRHEQSIGLARSLNEGLAQATGDLVARMDADDVCLPGRLREQLAFMQQHQDVSVLGTSVAVFSGECQRRPSKPDEQHEAIDLPLRHVHRIAQHPAEAAILAWSLYFNCCMAHPSVMLRRDRVIAAGGYDPCTEPAEDYDLWLRMEAFAPGCVANLSEVLLALRRHDDSVSQTRGDEQREVALAVVARAMSKVLNRDVTAEEAAAMRNPELAKSVSILHSAAKILCDLESAAYERFHCLRDNDRATEEVPVPGSSDDESTPTAHERERQGRAMVLVKRDAEGRLGALVLHAMRNFGQGAGPLLDIWRNRDPGQSLLHKLGENSRS